jgi:hypothetical protein
MVDDDEGRIIFDTHARKTLGISGEEFLRRYDAGEYQGLTDPDEYHKINRLVMMMPSVRRVPAWSQTLGGPGWAASGHRLRDQAAP